MNIMLVYGIRCSPNDLFSIRVQANADYYTDYSLLVFPDYTKPLCLNAHGSLTPEFWETVQHLVSKPTQVRVMEFEQPYITEMEAAVIACLQESYPGLQPEWYYVPRTHA